jgi:hypothetical protein
MDTSATNGDGQRADDGDRMIVLGGADDGASRGRSVRAQGDCRVTAGDR